MAGLVEQMHCLMLESMLQKGSSWVRYRALFIDSIVRVMPGIFMYGP